MENVSTVTEAVRERAERRNNNGQLYQVTHQCSNCTTQVSPMHRFCNYCGARFTGTINK